MSPSNMNDSNVNLKMSKSIGQKRVFSSSSDNSFGESSFSSDSVESRISTSSPLTTYKNLVKAARGAPRTDSGYLSSSSSSIRESSELKLDNAQRLSVMMSSNPLMDDIDESFKSDFDESERWLKQL